MSDKDTSILYSGMTSLTARHEQPQRKDAAKRKVQDKVKLQPAAEVVLKLIDQEKNRVKSIDEFDLEKMREDAAFKTELMARKLYYEYLRQLEGQVQTILREKPKRKETDDE